MDGIEKLIADTKGILLDGLKYPNGKTVDTDYEEKKLRYVLPNITKAYSHLLKTEKENLTLLSSVRYLARVADHNIGYVDYMLRDKPLQIHFVRYIANKAREFSLKNPKTKEERIEQAKLYSVADFFDECVFAASLRDQKRGCSSSVCSNCDEPIVYCDYACEVCKHELVNAHDMPTIEEWEKLDLYQKKDAFKHGINVMISYIRREGDWRGRESPLNRFKLESAAFGPRTLQRVK